MEHTGPRAARRYQDERSAEQPERAHDDLPVAEGPPEDEPVSEELAESIAAAPASVPRSPAHAALESLSKEELIDRHVRLVADVRRIRQRAKQEEDEARREERERVLSSLFDVLDTFERGLERIPAEERQDNPWAAGMHAIHRQMLDALAGFGVTPYAPVGEAFDALEQEALSTMPDPARADGSVAFVERTGYRELDRVLRPARVVVVKNA